MCRLPSQRTFLPRASLPGSWARPRGQTAPSCSTLASSKSDRLNGRSKVMPKQKLVVVGNGMAGARAVEEVLARGGGEQFDVVMFGDEPYGNYNRILLSNVLCGIQDTSEIFINPLG